jgi:hypothetical protein
MLNALEAIVADPIAKRFVIDDLLFAQFSCPTEEVGIWTQTDYLMHVLSGTSRWRTATGTGSARAGEAVFFKKGAYVLPHPASDELCVQLYFIPDGFVRDTILQLTAELPASTAFDAVTEGVIRVMPDTALSAFTLDEALYRRLSAETSPQRRAPASPVPCGRARVIRILRRSAGAFRKRAQPRRPARSRYP